MNGSIIGTLSEERIREMCKQNLLSPTGEEIVMEVIRNWDEEVNDPESDKAFVKERLKDVSEKNLILETIVEISEEFFFRKNTN